MMSAEKLCSVFHTNDVTIKSPAENLQNIISIDQAKIEQRMNDYKLK